MDYECLQIALDGITRDRVVLMSTTQPSWPPHQVSMPPCHNAEYHLAASSHRCSIQAAETRLPPADVEVTVKIRKDCSAHQKQKYYINQPVLTDARGSIHEPYNHHPTLEASEIYFTARMFPHGATRVFVHPQSRHRPAPSDFGQMIVYCTGSHTSDL